VGFADDDDEKPSGMSTPVVMDKPVVVPPTPQTPVNKRAPPTTISSKASNKSIPLGFADEDSEEDAPVPVMRNLSVSSDDVLSANELEGIGFVSDFIDTNSEYTFPTSISQEIEECIRTKRASSDRARELVESIRTAVASKSRGVEEALGYRDGIVDMANPVVLWVVSQAE